MSPPLQRSPVHAAAFFAPRETCASSKGQPRRGMLGGLLQARFARLLEQLLGRPLLGRWLLLLGRPLLLLLLLLRWLLRLLGGVGGGGIVKFYMIGWLVDR